MILKNSKFKYSKAREMILDAILAGNLAPDAILPSEQILQRQLKIGRNTLRSALHELEETGIIIKQHGRQSRVNLDALKAKQTPIRRIAWVDTSQIGYANQIYFDIFRSISETAAVRNVKVDYIPLAIDAMANNFFRKQQEYDGLILGEFTPEYQKYVARITHENTVCVDCPRQGISHCVKTDCFLGGQLAARTLADTGHIRPAFLGFTDSIQDYDPFRERFRGFADGLKAAGIDLPDEMILRVSTKNEWNDFSGFLKTHLPVLKQADSIFILTDRFAVSAMYTLPEMGLSIPDDLSIIGFDGMTLSQFVSPVLTTIRQPVEAIGRKALEIVLNPTERASYPPVIQIPPVLQSGGTVLTREEKSSVFNKNNFNMRGKKK
ncbi:MAG: GntR family transcriptional regulator [Lentisphaeria bacterium]|nr:GntR family transcriptional regulator [Lentisphaeria bacterium]